MSTTLHSFIDIFDTKFGEGQDEVQLKKIIIPIIQRDYAQGRKDPNVNRVRERFLYSLYQAVTEKPITLDFVYGDIDNDGVMTPLDGQQRLTTLFLLHWYASKKTVPIQQCSFLKQFGYETRYSARDFCSKLVDFVPTFTRKLSEEIINQVWFPLDWLKDPTISSMLVMLDAIDEKFKDVINLWDRLNNKAITFYFLPIKDMGLTDELYIKMNSRGKPLTLFEHFKAELEREVRLVDEKVADRVIRKIDLTWTDLLWQYRNGKHAASDDNTVDDEFLHYFNFVCDVICYRNGETPQRGDIFDLLQNYFSSKNEHLIENIETLENFFDCWCNIPNYRTPTEFLKSFMTTTHETGKIIGDTDIFENCLCLYSDSKGNKQFPLNKFVLLYAIIIYLQNYGKVTEAQFKRRIRIVNNLILNSEDEVTSRSDRNRIPAILTEVDAIICNGKVGSTTENNFNLHQIAEEKDKIEFLENYPDKAETLFALEDNFLLHGQIGIVGIENIDYAQRYNSLFSCDWDKIDCALMSIDNYGQRERRLYQYASSNNKSAWIALFHKSANEGFCRTKDVLIKLLSKHESFTNAKLQQIINGFITECEKNDKYPWRYYYVKYKEYRPGSYGKLSNSDAHSKPYMFSVLQTKTQLSSNAYMPYLKSADEKHLSKEELGQRLIYGDGYIVCENDEFILRNNEDDSIIETIKILQNDDGIDTEDRIIKLKKYIRSKRLTSEN